MNLTQLALNLLPHHVGPILLPKKIPEQTAKECIEPHYVFITVRLSDDSLFKLEETLRYRRTSRREKTIEAIGGHETSHVTEIL